MFALNHSAFLAYACLCSLFIATGAAGLQVDLKPYFNAKTASTGPNNTFADFDGFGRALPVEHLPKGVSFDYQGVEFRLPPFQNLSALDTVRAASQVISLPENLGFHSFHLLATAVAQEGHPAENRDYALGNVSFTFQDGSSSSAGFVIGGWWNDNPFDGPIQTPFFYANASIDEGKTIEWNTSTIGYVTVRIPSSQPLESITLPSVNDAIDIFALTLLETSPSHDSAVLTVQNVRPTTRWLDTGASGSERVQIIEVVLNNLAPLDAPTSSWLTLPHNVTIVSNDLDTVVPGRVVRLRTNDQITVKIGVKARAGVEIGSTVDVTVKLVSDDGGPPTVSLGGRIHWAIPVGIADWRNEDSSLRTHEPPDWYEDGKFGIFIHWGVYAVPAWAPSGKQYAEWYDWQLHVPANSSSPTWVHHKETYGENVVYDDFIANWTASNWNPDNWTDLFAAAGAKYFVLTSKHHDGFALFDTGESSHRNSIRLGPKRDIVKGLFDSAKARHPNLHRGVYFSLPEWYNPAYGPYGRRSWPGHPALNAYTGDCCDPFVGYVEVDDFITDIQKPQMETLFYDYNTDILWCDIGGPSAFPEIGGDWYNYAASQGRQVVMNNRCGANQSDFVTPEYTTFASPPFQKWETNAGLDPFSYGYNSDTPPENYQNASSIITELIDIVSKNGNFLLDIGPMADGTIIPEEREPLLQVGEWLSKSGGAIYGTRPWFIQPADQTEGMTNVRFTTTASAFHIIALSRPDNGTLKTAAPVPILQGDEVYLLGGSGAALGWTVDGSGVLNIEVSEDELNLINLPAWAFQVVYT